jgi:hypothetical protein
MKQIEIDDNTIWEETGQIVLNNNNYNNILTISYHKIYKEYKKNEMGFKLVFGDAIKAIEMSNENIECLKIMCICQNMILNSNSYRLSI